MDHCTLYPPNRRLLSDDVISSVMQRAWPSEDRTGANDGPTMTSNKRLQQQHSSRERTRAREAQSKVPQQQLYSTLHDGELNGRKSEKNRLRDSSSDMAVPKLSRESNDNDMAASLEHQRELRRMRQVRYRKKKFELTMQLEQDTKMLREDIESLERRRRDICAAVPTRKSVWDIAVSYFDLFRLGLQASTLMSATTQVPSSPQMTFLLTSMASDVQHNAGRGVDAMMSSWWCISRWFSEYELELGRLTKGVGGSLDATTTTSVTITERTLRNVFPSLWASKSDTRHARSALVKELLDRRVVMRGYIHFQWDSATGRVTSLMAQSDMLTPMLLLLQNLEEVLCVFEQSLISPDFHWRLDL